MEERVSDIDNASGQAMSEMEHKQVLWEQVRLLYQSGPYLMLGNTLCAALLAMTQWKLIDHQSIIIWLIVMAGAMLFRNIILYQFKHGKQMIDRLAHWKKRYTLSILGLALTWGSAGVFLFPQDHIVGQVTIILALILVISVVAAKPMVFRSALLITIVCTMPILVVHLLFIGSEEMIYLALFCSIYSIFLCIYGNKSYQMHLKNILFQVRYKEHEKLVQRAQYKVQETANILKMVAVGEPAQNIYDEILRLYESCYDGLRCSILILRGKRLFHVSAPSLPESYTDAINGVEIGPNKGSCGTAAYLGKQMLVEDIASDPRWQAFKAVTLPHGMRSCWSEPVLDKHGKVLGTLAMYRDEASLPNEEVLEDLQAAAQLVSIVMERELRESSLRTLSQAVEQAREAVIISDASGVIEYVNSAFTDMTGYKTDEVVGKMSEDLEKGKTEESYRNMWDKISGGEPWHATVLDQRKDGSKYPVMMSAAPIFEGKNISHYVIIKQDVTEHEALEGQFRQAQKMEAVGTLVGGIAHDFNNILAGITGNLYLAKRRSQTLPEVVRGIENIEQLAMRGADLIQRLMIFARKDQVDIKKIKLSAVVTEAIQLLRTSIPANIDMHQDMPRSALYIRGDSTQLHQVLMNLVNNAHDAVAEKSSPLINIRLEKFYPNADFIGAHPYFKPDYYAHLSVEDNGGGIKEAQVEHIFEPFFTTKEVGKGTGLGLAMVFGAVKRHDGFIEVESVEGAGATFHVYLPLIDAEDDTYVPSLRRISPSYEEGHETILVVDDDAFVLEIAREVLEDLGYQVLEACNGLEAVDVFTENQDKISLVITDVVMPKLGGIKAAEQIREIRPDMKIIFATGYDKSATLPSKVLASGSRILSKPYDIELMSQMIRKELDG